jgi:hypothetical protein
VLLALIFTIYKTGYLQKSEKLKKNEFKKMSQQNTYSKRHLVIASFEALGAHEAIA